MAGPPAKARARERVRARLASIPPEERERRAAKLPGRLAQLDAWRNGRGAVMAYLAFGVELSVDAVIRGAWASGRTVAVPRTDWDAKRIEPVAYAQGDRVIAGRHGVPEVAGAPRLPPEDLALVLVPGLAFTAHGARLGRGGGFYDRFLRRLLGLHAPDRGARPAFVGVCFEEQLEDDLPAEDHDIAMDTVIAL